MQHDGTAIIDALHRRGTVTEAMLYAFDLLERARSVDASGVVPPSAVPKYARTIRREVTDRGPGGHILTGPIYVNGAMP
jgi:hypothetical protein